MINKIQTYFATLTAALATSSALAQATLPELPVPTQPEPLPPLMSPAMIGATVQAINQAGINNPRQPRTVSHQAEVQGSVAAAFAMVASSVAQAHGMASQGFFSAHGNAHTTAVQGAQRVNIPMPAAGPADGPDTAERVVEGLAITGAKVGAAALLASSGTPSQLPSSDPNVAPATTPTKLPQGVMLTAAGLDGANFSMRHSSQPAASHSFTSQTLSLAQTSAQSQNLPGFIQQASWQGIAGGAAGGYLADKFWEELKTKSPTLKEWDCKAGAAVGLFVDGLLCPPPPRPELSLTPQGKKMYQELEDMSRDCNHNANQRLQQRWQECTPPAKQTLTAPKIIKI